MRLTLAEKTRQNLGALDYCPLRWRQKRPRSILMQPAVLMRNGSGAIRVWTRKTSIWYAWSQGTNANGNRFRLCLRDPSEEAALTFSVKSVANTFLWHAHGKKGRATISPMKLQKLVYCLHGWHLAIENEPVLEDGFIAWPHGPVNEEMYHIFKEYGRGPITQYATEWHDDEEKAYRVNHENSKFYRIFKAVYKKYMPYTAIQLSNLTHAKGTPWEVTKSGQGNELISDHLIKQHFISLAKRGQVAHAAA